VLLVLIEQIVEDLFIEQGNALEVVARARLKAHDLVNQPVRLMGEVRDVLLPLYLLSYIC
jgi:hypothetical protein